MRPPKGFETEKFPLRHKIISAFNLNMGLETLNTAFIPLVRSAKNTTATSPLTLPNTIQVNPHNANFEQDIGPLCAPMSIIDRLTITLKFTMTDYCQPSQETGSTFSGSPTAMTAKTYTGDSIPAFRFLWRPIFNVFPEKMDATDDQTGTSVSAILAMTKDATNEDVVPITTNKLVLGGPSDKALPISTVNGVEALTDYNMTTNLNMEDHVWDEDLLQEALRRYTNKGALRSCLGRTRHVTLTRQRPYQTFYIDKFVPRAIRRIQPYALFGIQVHLPLDSAHEQLSMGFDVSNANPHLGCKIITNYHEWNSEHDQERGQVA